MNERMIRGAKVIETATGRTATIIFAWPHGTDSHAEPWAKIMFKLTKEEGYGVSFACRDLAELCLESEPASETCDVLVADADYQDPARCGNTASYHRVNGTDRVCVFHRDSAVRLIPTSASHFERIGR